MNVDDRTLEEIHEQAQRERIAQKFGVDHFAVRHWYEDARRDGIFASWEDFYYALISDDVVPE